MFLNLRRLIVQKKEYIVMIGISSLLSLSSFLIMYQLLYLFEVEGRGAIVLTQTILSIYASFSSIGIHHNTQLYRGDEQKKIISQLLTLIFIFAGILSFIFIYPGLNLVSYFFQENPFQYFSRTSAFVVVYASALNYPIAAIVLLTKASRYVALTTVPMALLQILFLFITPKFLSINISTYLLFCSFLMLAAVFVNLVILNIKPTLPSRSDLKLHIRNGLNVTGWVLLKNLVYKLDLLVLPRILSPVDYGTYTVVQTIAQSVWRIADPVLAVYNRMLLMRAVGDYGKTMKMRLQNIFVMVASILILSMINILILYTMLGEMNYLDTIALVALSLASAIFILWKQAAVECVASGRNRFMYLTTTSYIFLYLFLSQFLTSKEHAYILIVILCLLMGLLGFHLSSISAPRRKK